MRTSMSPALPLTLLLAIAAVDALKLPFQARTTYGPSKRLQQKRATALTVPIANTHNAEYIANITLGGASVRVMLDTGR